jgi:putative ABC transport system permease protein
VTMRGSHHSLSAAVETYYRDYRLGDVFASMRRAPVAVATRIESIPGVISVRHRIVSTVTLDVPGLNDPATGQLVSIPEVRRPMLNDLHLVRGRWIAPNRPDEVLISESFAQANDLSLGDSIGAIINGRWRALDIVGTALSPEFIYEISPGDLLPDKQRFGIIWMGREALEAAFDMDGAFNDLVVALAHGANVRDVVSRVDTLIAPWGGAGAYGRDEHVSNRFIMDEINGLAVSAAIMPTIFLAVGAFLIHLVLSRLVQLQRDQIAILKAFGYSSAAVGLHYFELAMFTIAVGALLGIVGGVWLGSSMTQLYQTFYNFPILEFEAPLSLFTTSIAISAAAAGFGALWSVRQAIALPPAEAMRPEAPPRFAAGMIERSGIGRLLTPAARIIVRNILRRRAKSFFSIAGVAMAVAILVVGRFNTDAINYLMRVQFSTVQREDVTVSFVVPRSYDSIRELARLPGVLRVEPFRAAPVRISHGHRSRRTALMGMPRDATLRRLVDAEVRFVEMPAEGLMMTSYLAEILELRPGDMLTVEVLDESRPVRQIPLAGTVDELLGVSVYADIETVNQLMGEGRTVSGAYLLIDTSRMDELYAELKRMPAVAGVTSRPAMLASFQQTLAEMMSIMNLFVIGFASVIAIGVVYNSARIALSERGRELASLRVLGFTRGEVSAMLLGEQAILTAAAIPLGFLIGFLLTTAISTLFETDLYRFPAVISVQTLGFSFTVIAVAAILSGLLVHRRIRTLDLIEVLKTRE